MSKVYRFNSRINNKEFNPTPESLPIFDDHKILVGAFYFTYKSEFSAFVGGNGYPLALTVSLGDELYFTPILTDNSVDYAVLTEKPLNSESVKIRAKES